MSCSKLCIFTLEHVAWISPFVCLRPLLRLSCNLYDMNEQIWAFWWFCKGFFLIRMKFHFLKFNKWSVRYLCSWNLTTKLSVNSLWSKNVLLMALIAHMLEAITAGYICIAMDYGLASTSKWFFRQEIIWESYKYLKEPFKIWSLGSVIRFTQPLNWTFASHFIGFSWIC